MSPQVRLIVHQTHSGPLMDQLKSWATAQLDERKRVGDLFMSLIHTCRLNGINPFHYLTELQQHAGDLAQHPRDWMPWNYRATLQGLSASPAATA